MAPRSVSPWQRAGCRVARSSASSAGTPSSTATRSIWLMCPSCSRKSGSRSSVQKAQNSGPYSRTSGSRSRRFLAFEASRMSTQAPLRRFSRASS